MNYNPKVPNQVVRGNQVNGDCPFCGKSMHFFMNYNNGLWDCKKCGREGNWFEYKKEWKELLGVVFATEDGELVKYKKEDLRELSFRKITVEGKEEVDFVKKAEEIELPDGIWPIVDRGLTRRAYKYFVDEREFSPSYIEKYSLSYCNEGRMFNRIIIPVVMKNRVYGYIGRWVPIGGVEPKKKYLNNAGMHSSVLLWNYDNIKSDCPLVVCEGVFSAMRVGTNAVATFGKKLSYDQALLITKKTKGMVILLFDSDAKKQMIKIGEGFYGFFRNLRVLFLEKGDPDECRLSYTKVIKESEEFTPRKYVTIGFH